VGPVDRSGPPGGPRPRAHHLSGAPGATAGPNLTATVCKDVLTKQERIDWENSTAPATLLSEENRQHRHEHLLSLVDRLERQVDGSVPAVPVESAYNP